MKPHKSRYMNGPWGDAPMKLPRELIISTLAAAGVFFLVLAGWHPLSFSALGWEVFVVGEGSKPLAISSAVGTFLVALALTWRR